MKLDASDIGDLKPVIAELPPAALGAAGQCSAVECLHFSFLSIRRKASI
jgi:hypothetical protein